MKDEIREQLSALIDDELTDLERPLLLGRLQRDDELRACMGRYQLIGDVIRGGVTQASGLGIAARVQEALAQDHLGQASLHDDVQQASAGRSYWKPVAGFAIAASVALVAVFSIQNLQQTKQEAQQVAATEITPQAAPVPVVQVTTSDEQWNRIEPRVEKRLSGYLVNHSEFAASHGMQGLTPYVRIVGFEDAQ